MNIHEHDISEETRLIEDYVARGVNAILITPEAVDAFLQSSGTFTFCKKQGLPLADWREVKPAPPSR